MKFYGGKLAAVVLLFPSLYISAGIVFSFVHTYHYNDHHTADPAIGQDGTFYLLAYLLSIIALLASAGYAGVVMAKWNTVKSIEISRLARAVLLALLFSIGNFVIVTVIDKSMLPRFGLNLQSVTEIVNCLSAVMSAVVWTSIMLSLAEKQTITIQPINQQ